MGACRWLGVAGPPVIPAVARRLVGSDVGPGRARCRLGFGREPVRVLTGLSKAANSGSGPSGDSKTWAGTESCTSSSQWLARWPRSVKSKRDALRQRPGGSRRTSRRRNRAVRISAISSGAIPSRRSKSASGMPSGGNWASATSWLRGRLKGAHLAASRLRSSGVATPPGPTTAPAPSEGCDFMSEWRDVQVAASMTQPASDRVLQFRTWQKPQRGRHGGKASPLPQHAQSKGAGVYCLLASN